MSDTVNFSEYQKFCETTAKYKDAGTGSREELAYLFLGLAGEAGESVDVFKKFYRNAGSKPLDLANLRLELGDVMYYTARILQATGITMREVIQANIEKLTERNKQGTLHNR